MNSISLETSNKNVEQADCGGIYFYRTEPPTLQNIALVSLAVGLWTKPDIKDGVKLYLARAGFRRRRNYSANKAYGKFEEKVLQKLTNTHLPRILQQKVSNIIKPIGYELINCFAEKDEERNEDDILDKEYCSFYDILKVGGSLYWTMEGIIDKVKSLKVLIHFNDKEIKFYRLYELACKYCLEEYIPYLWNKLTHNKRNDIGYFYENYDNHLVAYWTASMENILTYCLDMIKQSDDQNIYDVNLSINSNMIALSIFISNPYSLKYFWNKMNNQEKEINLLNWLNKAVKKYTEEMYEYQQYKDKSTILCFLISQLNDNKDQQKAAFRAHSLIILKVLLFDWPWQRLLLPTISIMLDYISEKVFVEIMLLIVEEIKVGRNTNEIFIEIWFKSPKKLKKSFLQFIAQTGTIPNDSVTLIHRFLDMNDVETILEILKFATVKEKKCIIFSMIKNRELYNILYTNKLNFIDTLINSLPSIRLINTFKNYVMLGFADDLCQDWIKNNNFQAVEKFLKWGFQSSRQIQNFKRKFIDKNKIYSSLICAGNNELESSFLLWYFESDEEINEFKTSFELVRGRSL